MYGKRILFILDGHPRSACQIRAGTSTPLFCGIHDPQSNFEKKIIKT